MWKGSAFDCAKSDNEIVLFHSSGVARAMELVGHHCACAKAYDHTQ